MKSLWSLLLVATIALCLVFLPTQTPGLSNFRSEFAGRDVPTSAPGDAKPLVKAVYFIVIDGLRYDTAGKPYMPFLEGLKRKAAWGKAIAGLPSYSRPSYARLLSGAPTDLTGMTMNDQTASLTVPTIFSLAASAGLRTAASAHYWVGELAETSAERESTGRIRGGNIKDGYFYKGDAEPDTRVLNMAMDFIRSEQPQLVMVLPMSVDHLGHTQGGGSKAYKDNAGVLDAALADFFRSLPDQDYLAIITADHGHRKAGGHGGEEKSAREVPFFIFGTGVRPGKIEGQVDQLDFAPTIAAALSLPMAGSMGGRVLCEAFAEQKPWQEREHLLSEAQLGYLDQNAELLSRESGEHEGDFAQAWRSARHTYLLRGMLWRLPFAILLLAAFVAGAIFLLRRLQWRWPMLAGAAFPLYFYAILRLLREDYSYSAIVTPTECAIKVVLATLLSLAILTWAGAALRRHKESFFQPTALGAWMIQAVLTTLAWLLVGSGFHRFIPDLGWQVFLMYQLLVTALVSLYALLGWLITLLYARRRRQASGMAKQAADNRQGSIS